MRASRRRECYWEGFRDALVHGARNPVKRGDSAQIAYQEGYDDGERAIHRHFVAAKRPLPGKAGVLR